MRRFELIEGASAKFWEIELEGAAFTVRFGRLGTSGQSSTKSFADEAKARAAHDKLVREKTGKGYVEIASGGARATPSGSEKRPSGSDGAPGDEALAKALADIEEWFTEHSAEAIVQNLAPPATPVEIAELERALGLPLPDELRALYRVHDGQRDIERDVFLPFGAFLPLRLVLAETKRALSTHFGSEAERGGTIDPDATTSTPSGGLLTSEERTTEWVCFAAMESFHTMIHLRTGRVFQWVRQDAIRLLAGSFREYFLQFADNLWGDAYVLQGDPRLEGVEEQGFVYLKRHLGDA